MSSLLLLRAGSDAAAGGGGGYTNTETTTWVSNVASAGGSVSSTQGGYVDTLISSLKTALGTPLSSQISRLWLAATSDNDVNQFKVDLIHGSLLDFTNAGTGTAWNKTTGYTGDGSSQYIKTGFIPGTSDSSVYTLNSATLGVHILSSSNVAATVCIFGSNDGANSDAIFPLYSGNYNFNSIHDATTIGITSGPTSVFGLQIATRTGASAVAAYQYQSASPSSATGTNATAGMPAYELYLAARNGAGTAQFFCSHSIGAAIIGRGYTLTESNGIAAALNSYMTSVGAAHW